MGRVFLQEGEELLAQFHPHPGYYWDQYAWGALWVAWGTAAYWLQQTVLHWPPGGLFLLAILGVLHAALTRWFKRGGLWLALGWSMLAAGLGTTVWVLGTHRDPFAIYWSAALGALAATVALAFVELERRSRAFTLTSNRFRVESGVARRYHHAIDLSRVQAVRANQDLGARLFGYGHLAFVFGARPRKKSDELEEQEVIRGVPRFEEVLHLVETAVAEGKLPERDRRRRAEERRLKRSMERLAGWVARGAA